MLLKWSQSIQCNKQDQNIIYMTLIQLDGKSLWRFKKKIFLNILSQKVFAWNKHRDFFSEGIIWEYEQNWHLGIYQIVYKGTIL